MQPHNYESRPDFDPARFDIVCRHTRRLKLPFFSGQSTHRHEAHNRRVNAHMMEELLPHLEGPARLQAVETIENLRAQ